jgi:hypothetical protein
MKTTIVLLAFAGIAAAQSNPLTDAFQARYRSVRSDLIETAEVFPADAYDYRLTPQQRTVAEWLGHTAMATFSACAAIKGEAMPEAGKKAAKVAAKPEASQAIRDAFAYCDAAIEGMNDQKALKAVDIGGKPTAPAQGMINLIATTNEHYGNLVGYMRSKGIVPPSTARAQKKK